jgi:hypothetical protein
VLVLGSATAARPHLINIKGYPAGLSVLDFLELAEAGKTFDKVLYLRTDKDAEGDGKICE